MAKTRRALLKNNHLRNCDYFAIVSSCSHFTKVATNPTAGLVYALLKLNEQNWRFMVECPSCHQNGKYINFTLLFCTGWHGVLRKWIAHGKHAYSSSDQSNSQCMALSLPFLSLMLKVRNSEHQQPRGLRQIERQVKINICTMGAILRLLLFAGITLKLDR